MCACRSEAGPLLEVDLELVTPNMVWKPELDGSEKGSVQALVERWLTSFLEVWTVRPAIFASIDARCLREFFCQLLHGQHISMPAP